MGVGGGAGNYDTRGMACRLMRNDAQTVSYKDQHVCRERKRVDLVHVAQTKGPRRVNFCSLRSAQRLAQKFVFC